MQHLMGLLLASVITLAIATVHMPRLAELEQQRFDNGSATQFEEFVRASQRFIQTERQNLVSWFAANPASDPRSFAASDLAAAGALSSRFADRNTFGHRHALIAHTHPQDPRHIEALAVTYGGETMSRRETARLALNAGPRAGLVHEGLEREVWGASGQWSVPVSEFAGGSVNPRHTPTKGHLAALLSTQATLAPAGLAPAGIATSGQFINAPLCPAGTPEIYVMPVQFSDNGHGYPVVGVQALAESAIDGSGWTVRIFLFREHAAVAGTEERIELAASHGRAAVFTWCD